MEEKNCSSEPDKCVGKTKKDGEETGKGEPKRVEEKGEGSGDGKGNRI